MNDRSTISRAIGDDTIELQLTAQQLLELSQAAELAERGVPPNRSRRWRLTPIAKFTGATIGYVALAWWSASLLVWRPEPTVAATTPPPVFTPQPALMTGSSQEAVRVSNPFDATEVFEFPAGTSHAEGREKVAQILLQRARERQSQWEHLKPAASPRSRFAS